MSRPEYKHQCRYCAFCVYTMNETFWCDRKHGYCAAPKRPNRCSAFLFNDIPADGPLEKHYTPRKPRKFKQLRFEDLFAAGAGGKDNR